MLSAVDGYPLVVQKTAGRQGQEDGKDAGED